MGCMFLTHVSWSQDLYVGSSAAITTLLWWSAGVSIIAGGDVTIDSNAVIALLF